MSFVYHIVPRGMEGKVLYPLNTLKDILPDTYEREVKKYDDREIVLTRRINKLNCLWNDVIHFSVLNPSIMFGELRKLGLNFTPRYFEVPAERLEAENTVVYLNSPHETGTPVPESDYVAYDPNDLEKYAYLPEATIEYYRETIRAGGNPMVHHLLPHVLYKGPLDTADLEIKTA